MMRRLLDRNIATLVVVVLAGQLLAAVLLYQLVMRPQTARLAEVTAEMTDTVGRSMAQMSAPERRELVARFNQDDAVLIRPGDEAPDIGLRRPTLIESEFLKAIAHRLNHDRPLEWRCDTGGRLWVRLWLGGEDWWVSLTPRRMRAPLFSTLIALGSAVLAAIAGGIVLHRFTDRPLRALVRAVDAYDPDHPDAPPIAEAGPQEIAAVAHAFNRLTARIAAQEAERALMLGAVSHDLRTPLTRLRLSLEMLHGADPALLAGAARQVERIDAMLGQFLDLARGFDMEPAGEVDLPALLAGAAFDAGFDGAGDALTMRVEVARGHLRPVAAARAVSNLLANARRHGAAPFGLAAWREGGDLVIEISDAGAGFDPAEAEALCRPFARGDAARGGDHAGLGLAIVARIAAAQGGSLGFARREGRFCARLRLPQPGAPGQKATAA